MGNFDVTGNIRIIERLKADILGDVAELYASMCAPGGGADTAELLADLVILTYTLSQRLGTTPAALDSRITNKLRLGVLDDNEPLRAELQAIMDRKRS